MLIMICIIRVSTIFTFAVVIQSVGVDKVIIVKTTLFGSNALSSL